MEEFKNGMHIQQSSPLNAHVSSDRCAALGPISPNDKSSSNASTSAPSGITTNMPMDSDSDDEKPLALRKIASNMEQVSSSNMSDPVKDMISSKSIANGPMKRGSESEINKQEISSRQGSDDSEDEKPLAARINQHKAGLGRCDNGESDDDKPLIFRKALSNGIATNKSSTTKGQNMNNFKKRPLDAKDEQNPIKKLKFSPTSSKPSRMSEAQLSQASDSTRDPLSNVTSNSSSRTMLKSSAVLSKSSSIASTSNPPSNQASGTSKSSSPVSAASKSKTVQMDVDVDEDEDDIPLVKRIPVIQNKRVKMDVDEDEDEDDIPLAQRIPTAKLVKKKPVKSTSNNLSSSLAAKKVVEARKSKFKKQQKKLVAKAMDSKQVKSAPGADGGQKWTHLEHNGVIFPPPYKPHGVKMLYEGKPVVLTPEQEEVATMFAVMRETDYVQKKTFLLNFWNDWKKILGPGHVIQSLDHCDFTPIYEWHLAEKEKKKQMSSEEKKILKEEKLKQEEKYMWALVDGVKEKVGNFRVEPPGLFRGRGEHPKMGKLKRRIFPEDIVINIGKGVPVPECPIPGHRWKEIRNDNTVTWLAYWVDPINQREFKYVFLSPSSNLKGQSDKEKYEKARTLKDYIEDIRRTYTKNFKSADMTKKQIAVATYLIDRLALRAGNEKDDDEADTVGCCSLKVEHVTLVPPKSLQFDFLGKDSIRYFNVVEVEEAVYKAVGEFRKSKKTGDDLFDKLDTNKLNTHLKNIMPQLTAKVFRTYNASITLDTLLVETDGQTVAEKLAAYQWANKEVAILCNHQRSVSKSHGAQMEKLESKMTELEELLQELRTDLSRAKKGKPPLKDADGKPKRNQNPEALEKKIAQTEQKIEKMKLDMRIKDDLKTVALGTSKINYMDPRITVAWCKRHEVPIEKIFNKSLLAKFAWAMDVSMDYRF